MTTTSSSSASVLASLLIAAGLATGGWFAGQGLAKFRTDDRYVVVKGLAEREVPADLVVWPLGHAVMGNELAPLQSQLDANTDAIRRFFRDAGFADAEIVVSAPKLEDRAAWAWGESQPNERFRYQTTVTLRSTRVPEAIEALRNTGQLVAGGVLLTEGGFPSFEFTGLNAIKPALIAEATANAREAAEQFAQDAKATVGGIRNANQGVITINDRDQGSPHVKLVRVVSTVEYFLRN